MGILGVARRFIAGNPAQRGSLPRDGETSYDQSVGVFAFQSKNAETQRRKICEPHSTDAGW